MTFLTSNTLTASDKPSVVNKDPPTPPKSTSSKSNFTSKAPSEHSMTSELPSQIPLGSHMASFENFPSDFTSMKSFDSCSTKKGARLIGARDSTGTQKRKNAVEKEYYISQNKVRYEFKANLAY